MAAKQLTIGVKFCGNCNPVIPAQQILDELKARIVQQGLKVSFVSWDAPVIDILLVISGCPVDCASRPEALFTEITIAGETINRASCSPENISGKILAILKASVEEENK